MNRAHCVASVALLAGALVTAAPRAAGAQQASAVTLTSGAELYGWVVEQQPGRWLTLRQANGSLSVIPWQDVQSVSGSAGGTENALTAPAEFATRSLTLGLLRDAYLLPRAGAAPLELDSRGRPEVVSVDAILAAPPPPPATDSQPTMAVASGDPPPARPSLGATARVAVCVTPCVLRVPPGRLRLYFDAPGTVSTMDVIDVEAGGTHALVQTRSNAFMAIPIILGSVGFVTSVVGTALLSIDTGTMPRDPGLLYAGLGTLGGGALLFAAAFVLGWRPAFGVVSTTPLDTVIPAASARARRTQTRLTPWGLEF